MEGRWRGCGDFSDRLAESDEGPGGDEREEMANGFEADLVGAVGVVRAPLLAELIKEDADAGFAEAFGFACGGCFKDSNKGRLSAGRSGDNKESEEGKDGGYGLHNLRPFDFESGRICMLNEGAVLIGMLIYKPEPSTLTSLDATRSAEAKQCNQIPGFVTVNRTIARRATFIVLFQSCPWHVKRPPLSANAKLKDCALRLMRRYPGSESTRNRAYSGDHQWTDEQIERHIAF